MHMICLENFECEDFDTLISWVDSPETLMQFAGPSFSFPLTAEQLETSLQDLNRHAFKAVDVERKKMMGYGEIYFKLKTAFLGRIIIGEQNMRGRGLGLVLVQQLTHYAYRLNPQQIELNVFDWNIAAIKCYQKAGFVFDPDKRLQRKANGKSWTVLNMVLQKDATNPL